MQFKNKCEKNGLFIPQTILYQTTKTTAIRIGFAHLTKDEIDEIVQILKNELETKAE